MRNWLRWLLLLLCLGCLGRILLGKATAWTIFGFFATGAAWYGLTWLRTRALDAPRPR